LAILLICSQAVLTGHAQLRIKRLARSRPGWRVAVVPFFELPGVLGDPPDEGREARRLMDWLLAG
jgi:hypothetical protein